MPGMDDLRNYQKQGVRFLLNRGAALLADQQGLGKTPQTIMAVREDNAKRILIFAPKSMLYVWKAEIEVWDSDAKVFILSGSGRDKKKMFIENYKAGENDRRYFITNYETLVARSPIPFANVHWSWVIADEVHFIKNRKAKRTRALKAITNVGKKKVRKVGLSGTPMANSPDEIWSILNWLDPVRWSSYWKFVDTYMSRTKTRWGWEIGKLKYDGALLREDLRPFMLRRMKRDVLRELPDKQYQYIWTDISSTQYEMYESMKNDFCISYGDVHVDAEDILPQLTRFRQLVVSPAVVDSHLPDDSPRLDAVTEYILDADAPLLVVGEYVSTVHLLFQRIQKRDPTYPLWLMFAEDSAEQRQKTVQEFQAIPENGRGALIGTVGLLGVGLTLHRASTILFVDRAWSPMVNEQAEDRLHRYGQKNAVNVVIFGIPGTIDERVTYKLIDKNKTTGKVMPVDLLGVPPKPGKATIVSVEDE